MIGPLVTAGPGMRWCILRWKDGTVERVPWKAGAEPERILWFEDHPCFTTVFSGRDGRFAERLEARIPDDHVTLFTRIPPEPETATDSLYYVEASKEGREVARESRTVEG